MRYGLTYAGERYFRKYILPEPFDVMRRRAMQTHHWSRFTLMVLDVVLGDLEGRGHLQFLNTFKDHIALVHSGVDYLHHYYENKVKTTMLDFSDKYGVEWLE